MPLISFLYLFVLFKIAGGLKLILEARVARQGITQEGAPTHRRIGCAKIRIPMYWCKWQIKQNCIISFPHYSPIVFFHYQDIFKKCTSLVLLFIHSRDSISHKYCLIPVFADTMKQCSFSPVSGDSFCEKLTCENVLLSCNLNHCVEHKVSVISTVASDLQGCPFSSNHWLCWCEVCMYLLSGLPLLPKACSM